MPFPGTFKGPEGLLLLLVLDFLHPLPRLCGLVWPFAVWRGFLVDGTRLLRFLWGYNPSHISLNISLAVLRSSGNSVILLKILPVESNPCISSNFFHSCGRGNSMSYMIFSSVKSWSCPKRWNYSIYSTISFTWQTNSQILESQGLNNPQKRGLFCSCSALGSNKWAVIPLMNKF